MDMQQKLNQLQQDGIIILENIIPEQLISNMQNAFSHRLKRLNFNSTMGSQRTEIYRNYVEDLLSVDQSFLKTIILPTIQFFVKQYISNDAVLMEARGWETKIVKKEFHGWHKDGWYDKKIYVEPPRQLKVAIYLTDVETGPFAYVKGSHKNVKSDPFVLHKHYSDEFVGQYKNDIVKVTGKAGTIIIFDTAGIHRQMSPNLSERRAIFFTFHSPDSQIDPSELEYGRYGPIIINNLFVDEDVTLEDLKFLGFFQKHYASVGSQQSIRFPWLSWLIK